MSHRNTDRQDFFYLYYSLMPSMSYLQDLSQEPPFWPGLSPKQRTPESHLPLSYTRISPVSANISGESQQSPSTSNSDNSPDAISASRTEQRRRKSYKKWSEGENKLLVQLWLDNFDGLESKDARKVWERIAHELSTKCGTKKTSDKCQKKMKYWIARYKAAKDWNRRQSGGNQKQLVFYAEIDQILGCGEV